MIVALGLLVAGWPLGACCMIRITIRVFQAVEAWQPQRPGAWWDVMNNIHHVQLRNTYALEVIGLLIGPAAMFVAIKHLFPSFPNPG